MMVWRKNRAAILLIWLALGFIGCTYTLPQPTQELVINEYLLAQAGFSKLDVNDTTPQRQALMNTVPKRQFITYHLDGAKWYVYADERSQTMYLGDEAAYQRYVAKTKDKQLCQSLDAPDSAPFWSCYQELQGAKK